MQKSLLLAFLCCGAMFPALAGDGVNTVSSTLRSAIVYRSGAELVHTATARLTEGNNELAIDDVSTVLDPASIRVGCSGSVTVMAVTFSKDFLQPQGPSAIVKKLRDSLDMLARESERIDVLTKSDQQLLELLQSNKHIGGSQTGVSAAELAKMMDYYRQQEVTIRTEIAGYADKQTRIKESSDKIDNQIDEEEKKNTTTSGRIDLELMAPVAGTYDFTISYLTNAAHWEPAYDLKVAGTNDSLQLIYKARVEQSSGIDWKNVKLSLSTSTPSEGGNAPVLKAAFLRFAEAMAAGGNLQGKAAGLAVQPGSPELSDVVVTGYGVEKKKLHVRGESSVNADDPTPLYVVDGSAMSKDEFDRIDPNVIGNVQAMGDAQASNIYGSGAAAGAIVVTLKKGVGDYLNINDNRMDVVFDIGIPYNIPSDGKEQGVELKEYKLPCAYQYYAAPVADKAAYLLGQMQGWEKLNLLPGEASIMVEGTYIGKSFIDPASTRDTLNLTLGQDKRIVVTREKVTDYSSVKFLGSSKKETFTYQITVRNNKKAKVRMLLKDQYPVSTDKDIECALLQDSGAAVDKDNGILSWTMELAPGESKQFRISYSIKYPKDKAVNIN